MNQRPETRDSLLRRLPDACDAEAWDEVMGIYGPLVYRLARARGLQPADAEDVVQEVFAALARHIDDWLTTPRRGPFRAWLLCIARNTAINFLTRRKHRSLANSQDGQMEWLMARPESGDFTTSEGVGEFGGGAFELEYRRELFRRASNEVRDSVSPRTWQAFWATAVEQHSVGDVARQLRMTEGNVYIARCRVMSKLRDCVRRYEEAGS